MESNLIRKLVVFSRIIIGSKKKIFDIHKKKPSHHVAVCVTIFTIALFTSISSELCFDVTKHLTQLLYSELWQQTKDKPVNLSEKILEIFVI